MADRNHALVHSHGEGTDTERVLARFQEGSRVRSQIEWNSAKRRRTPEENREQRVMLEAYNAEFEARMAR